MDLRSYVLDAEELMLGDHTGKKTSLLDIDDALIGDDPGVQIIIDNGKEKEKPNEQIISAGSQNGQRIDRRILMPKIGIQKEQIKKDQGQNNQYQKQADLFEQNEYILAHDLYHFFIRQLMREAVNGKHTKK